jgi:hypothetical protein
MSNPTRRIGDSALPLPSPGRGEPIGDLSALENLGAIALIQIQARK